MSLINLHSVSIHPSFTEKNSSVREGTRFTVEVGMKAPMKKDKGEESRWRGGVETTLRRDSTDRDP